MAVDTLSSSNMAPLPTVRIAALADVHFGRHRPATVSALLARISEDADVLLLCGDLTDHGDPEEARGLVREINQSLHIPAIGVLGNHDCHLGHVPELLAILREGGITMLDGDSCEVRGVGFAGVKGFCGGFGPHALGPWGESAIKQFVQESIDEALKLETALARVRNTFPVVLMHYAPIAATVVGEPPEIQAFLGSSRLEEPLARYGVTAVFHGHAHHGQPRGALSNGTPVYNVSWPLLARTQPERPYVVIEWKPACAATHAPK